MGSDVLPVDLAPQAQQRRHSALCCCQRLVCHPLSLYPTLLCCKSLLHHCILLLTKRGRRTASLRGAVRRPRSKRVFFVLVALSALSFRWRWRSCCTSTCRGCCGGCWDAIWRVWLVSLSTCSSRNFKSSDFVVFFHFSSESNDSNGVCCSKSISVRISV